MQTMAEGRTDFAPYFRSCQGHWGRDEALMNRACELRYQVYCLECGFLEPGDYAEQRESDEHDVNSSHFCASNLRDEMVGYVRLVRADALQTFPFQSHCTALLDGAVLSPPTESAEISRLMVRQDYRRRVGDIVPGVNVESDVIRPAHDLRANSPQILLSLYRQMYAYSLENGIRYWYAAMERSLARVLTRMNFSFRQIGPQTDYYGPVAPYMADLRELEDRVGQSNPALLAWMHNIENND